MVATSDDWRPDISYDYSRRDSTSIHSLLKMTTEPEDIVARTLKAKNSYVKHLCVCRCVLPQFVDSPDPEFHQFTVFSLVSDVGDQTIVPSIVKCNYCGALSRVVGLGVLEPLKAEHSTAVETAEEIQDQLPSELLKKLGVYLPTVDFPTWQEIRHVYENETCWGVCPIVLAHETDDKTGAVVAKVLNILGKTIYNVRTVTVD